MLSLASTQTRKNNAVPPEVTEILNQVYPGVRVSRMPSRAKNAAPVEDKLKAGTSPARIKQCPLRIRDCRKIKEITDNFLEFGLLIECDSKLQHPNLTDEKSDSKSCSLVQDLRASNRIVECIHPEVANPYTLINQIKE